MRFYSICLGAIAYCECYKKIKHTLFVIHGCPLSLCNSLFSVFRDELKKKIIIKENDDVVDTCCIFSVSFVFFYSVFFSARILNTNTFNSSQCCVWEKS